MNILMTNFTATLTRVGVLAAISIASPVFAQSAPPSAPPPLTGTIAQVSGQSLTVKSSDHGNVVVTLPANVQIITQKIVSLDAVKSNLFIGVTAAPDKAGKLQASEVHIFPESMRGAGEGHYPWQGPANTTMTNGNVAAAASNATTMTNGNVKQTGAGNAKSLVVKVNYKGGETEIEVGPEVPITLLAPTDKSALKVGTPMMAFVSKGADNTAVAQTIMLNPGPTPK